MIGSVIKLGTYRVPGYSDLLYLPAASPEHSLQSGFPRPRSAQRSVRCLASAAALRPSVTAFQGPRPTRWPSGAIQVTGAATRLAMPVEASAFQHQPRRRRGAAAAHPGYRAWSPVVVLLSFRGSRGRQSHHAVCMVVVRHRSRTYGISSLQRRNIGGMAQTQRLRSHGGWVSAAALCKWVEEAALGDRSHSLRVPRAWPCTAC